LNETKHVASNDGTKHLFHEAGFTQDGTQIDAKYQTMKPAKQR